MKSTSLNGFLEAELGKPDPDQCLFHVIPAGFEKSVSYGGGTALGPQAILTASQYLELYDGVSVPADRGIYTLPPIPGDQSAEDTLSDIEAAVTSVITSKKIPVLLGGEHTVSVGAFRALSKLDIPMGIVHFDAHADLRDTYEGSNLSHACALHHAVEAGFTVFQIGVRSLSTYDVAYREKKSVHCLDAWDLFSKGIPSPLLPSDFPENIYITFDVDGLDPSVIPATGTPEPGGLFWFQAMDMLLSSITGRKVVGFDVVELAPIPGHHASDFAAARLVYNIMGMISRHSRNPQG
ncbi:MAG: agmatinase [Proteobacteria bacterium]|nr:agmatinase [Pseudomonadota bacterium]